MLLFSMLIGLAIISLDGKLKSNMQPVLNGFEAPMIAYFAICIIALTSFWIAVVPDIFSNTSTIQMLADTKLMADAHYVGNFAGNFGVWKQNAVFLNL